MSMLKGTVIQKKLNGGWTTLAQKTQENLHFVLSASVMIRRLKKDVLD